jgi:hypothetical protein
MQSDKSSYTGFFTIGASYIGGERPAEIQNSSVSSEPRMSAIEAAGMTAQPSIIQRNKMKIK